MEQSCCFCFSTGQTKGTKKEKKGGKGKNISRDASALLEGGLGRNYSHDGAMLRSGIMHTHQTSGVQDDRSFMMRSGLSGSGSRIMVDSRYVILC